MEKTLLTKRNSSRKTKAKRLPVRRAERGLDAGQIVLNTDAAELAPLTTQVQNLGGTAIGGYREPFSGHPVLLATLPIAAVAPTPFQRDLSPTHTKRLAQKIEESGSFLDPIIVVRGADGKLWTPNGRHRLAAAKVLGLKQITALLSPDEALAFRILALNTEKAHNLKDRALEVIRMARTLAKSRPRARETEFAAEFEAPEFLTLGILYEDDSRFAGGAYSSFLKKLDRFGEQTLTASLARRQDYAARLRQIDVQVKKIVAKLQARGFKSPYLRNYVVARINPVRWVRLKKNDKKPPMPLAAALTRMAAAAARDFNVESVKPSDLAIVAALSSE